MFHCCSTKSLVYELIRSYLCSLQKITGVSHLGGPDEESNFNLFARYAVLKTVVCTGTLIRTIDEGVSLLGVVRAPLSVTIEIFISVTLLNFCIHDHIHTMIFLGESVLFSLILQDLEYLYKDGIYILNFIISK